MTPAPATAAHSKPPEFKVINGFFQAWCDHYTVQPRDIAAKLQQKQAGGFSMWLHAHALPRCLSMHQFGNSCFKTHFTCRNTPTDLDVDHLELCVSQVTLAHTALCKAS
jgi:hypothetical protein